jgi:hypothetical protein
VKKLILDDETHHQLVIVYHGSADYNFAHAACFVRSHNYRKQKQMLLLDCKNKSPIVCPRLGQDQMWFSESLKINEDIVAGYHMWEIYALERREVVDEMERVRITNRMMYVLTGDQQYQAESLVAGGLTTQQKRNEKKRKRRGRFTRRPDRTLNEKKKGRAEAQKANASRESEQELPINHADDAVMEVPDDQPLDYEMNDYLDVPSKHSLFSKSLFYRHPPRRLR